MSIQDMWEKFKHTSNDWLSDDFMYMSLIIMLVAVISFGLGRLSERWHVSSFNQSQAVAATVEVMPHAAVADETVVASISGTKYHLPWCAGAQQMKEENKIYFNSAAEARAAGYEPAGNCPGLQ